MRKLINQGRVLAAMLGIAVLATACGSASSSETAATTAGGDSQSAEPASGEPVTLTLATFNEFGYEDLITEYEALHPNITIIHKKAATTNEARDNLTTRLAAGSGLSDIEAVEVDWLAELTAYPDQFVDLAAPEVENRWLDWKAAAATTEDGKLIGYGTDIGPQAVCYRADLFEKAGLPSDRESVKAMLGTTWDEYFAAGRKFVETSGGIPWMDSAGANYLGMINQIEYAFEDADGTVIAATNPEVRKIYDTLIQASVTDNLSAHLAQWSEDWSKSFQANGFATILCPGWMLGVIEGNAEGVSGWDIADTFPGGGGNWGGSYLTVPSQGAHPEEAKALAAWLTAPQQQLKAFQAKGTFPSQVEALSDPELLTATNVFFNDAPTGEILANRAAAVTVQPHKGENYFAISDAFQQALQRVDVDQTEDPQSSWDTFVQSVAALG